MTSGVIVGLFSGCETNITTVPDDDNDAIEQIGQRIACKQTYILMLSFMMLMLATGVFAASVSPGVGACTHDITFESLPKIPFFALSLWAAMLTYQMASFNFGLQPKSVPEWGTAALFYHMMNITGMVMLQISCILEFQTKTSFLYQQNDGATVLVFVALTTVSELLSMFTMWRAWVYNRDVRALVVRWGVQKASPAPNPGDARENQDTESKKEK